MAFRYASIAPAKSRPAYFAFPPSQSFMYSLLGPFLAGLAVLPEESSFFFEDPLLPSAHAAAASTGRTKRPSSAGSARLLDDFIASRAYQRQKIRCDSLPVVLARPAFARRRRDLAGREAVGASSPRPRARANPRLGPPPGPRPRPP